MAPDKTRRAEDEYIAKEEAEKTKRLKEQLKAKQLEEQREQTKAVCYMKCPKCGADLNEVTFRGIKIDRCLNCDGVWLDEGELQKLAGDEESSTINNILHIITGMNLPSKY
jgi:hypothetical protein